MRERSGQRKFTSSAQEAVFVVLEVAAHVQADLAAICAQYGVTPEQYNVLRILRSARPAGCPRYEISSRLVDRAPDVTRLLDRLERRGLVERLRSASDRRVSLTRVTGAGLALLEHMDPEVSAVAERYASGLAESSRQQLLRYCEDMLP